MPDRPENVIAFQQKPLHRKDTATEHAAGR